MRVSTTKDDGYAADVGNTIPAAILYNVRKQIPESEKWVLMN